jgi:RNA polymerase sigma factor (sigma-70 family)
MYEEGFKLLLTQGRSQMTSDERLLHRYSNGGDPTAFRGLVDRHAGLVFSTSLRITGDRQLAEDVCQDCFLELASKCRTVRENVAGWLHALATSRSLNAIRARKRRAQRELDRVNTPISSADVSQWKELQPLIDRALNGLSDDLRLPIILHYLQGKSQQQVAERLGMDQATVSRRLQRGVELLRQRLRSFGVLTTVAAVTSLFSQSSVEAASPSLTTSLAKVGLGGVGVTVAKSTFSGTLSWVVMLGAVAENVLLFLLLQGWLFLLLVAAEFALLMRPPAWVRELLRAHSFGRDVVAHPMYPFRRWTWTIPPSDWKQCLVAWSFVGFSFALVAFGNLPRIKTQPGSVVAFGLMAILFLSLVVRLAARVWRQRAHLADSADTTTEEARQWTSWENVIGAAFGALVAATWLWSMPPNKRFTLSLGAVLVWNWIAVCSVMAVWALIERRRQRDSDNGSSSEDQDLEMKPVARRYHLALISGLVLIVTLFLSSAVVRLIIPERPPQGDPVVHRYTNEGVRVRVEVPAAFKRVPSSRGRPLQLVVAASMGLIFSLFLLRRVIKLRGQLPRPVSLPLLSVSVLAVCLGVGLTAYGAWKREIPLGDAANSVSPAISEQQEPVFRPTPAQLELLRKYAHETAIITVPDEQLPQGWYIRRYDNGLEMLIPQVSLHREVAQRLGLPDVPEYQSIVATFIRMYENPFAPTGTDGVCTVYAFCCENAADARRLNDAWQTRGLCVDRLVIFAFGRKGLRAPSLTDQAPVPTLLNHIQQSTPESDNPN